MFELEDLTPTDRGVKNTRYNTHHLHEFTSASGQPSLTVEEMERQYPQARRNFEILANDFRALLHRPGPYLYVVQSAQFSAPETVGRLIGLLERDPSHAFHVLVVGIKGFDRDFSMLGPRVSKAWRVLDSVKPDKFRWEGDDASWDEIFASIPLGYHEAGFHEPQSVAGWAAPPSAASSIERDEPAFGKVRQAGSLPKDAEVIWRGGPDAVFCAKFWRDQGASLESRCDGAFIRTIPKAWSYSQAAELDFSNVDLHRQQAWIRLEIADVAGQLMAGLYDPVADTLADEIPIDNGSGPFEVYIPAKNRNRSMLMLRTGGEDRSVQALIRSVEIVGRSLSEPGR